MDAVKSLKVGRCISKNKQLAKRCILIVVSRLILSLFASCRSLVDWTKLKIRFLLQHQEHDACEIPSQLEENPRHGMTAKVRRGPINLKAYYLTMGCKVGVYVWQSGHEEQGNGWESGIWLDFVTIGHYTYDRPFKHMCAVTTIIILLYFCFLRACWELKEYFKIWLFKVLIFMGVTKIDHGYPCFNQVFGR